MSRPQWVGTVLATDWVSSVEENSLLAVCAKVRLYSLDIYIQGLVWFSPISRKNLTPPLTRPVNSTPRSKHGIKTDLVFAIFSKKGWDTGFLKFRMKLKSQFSIHTELFVLRSPLMSGAMGRYGSSHRLSQLSTGRYLPTIGAKTRFIHLGRISGSLSTRYESRDSCQ